MANEIKPALLIDGTEHRDWSSYEIDSDLMVPADAWNFTLGPDLGALPAQLAEGKEAKIMLGAQVIMSGRLDSMTHNVSRRGVTLSISGRDGAGSLVDCSSPVFVAKMIGFEQIVAKIVRPLGVTKIRIDADKTGIRNKINVEPGETAWDTLQHAAEANGLWPWFEPDGTLVIGRPDYTQAPVATLVMKRDGRENNLVSLTEHRDISKRHSVVTVVGQRYATHTVFSFHAPKLKKGVVEKVLDEAECLTQKEADEPTPTTSDGNQET